MEQQRYEPFPDGLPPRPCAQPHSAPSAWLKAAAVEPPAQPPPATATAFDSPDTEPTPPALPNYRRDGWTAAARAEFLEVLAETGRIGRACAAVGLSRQSANALRTRDPVFAASVDAAWLLARDPLADAMYDRAVDGVTEVIVKDGKIVAERRRFDLRLSMAVLARLDKRCDLAAQRGGPALALVQRWDEWLSLVARGDDKAAFEELEFSCRKKAEERQLRQLPLRRSPIGSGEPVRFHSLQPDRSERCWKDAQGRWMTTFPPPPGFAGYESRVCDGLNYYERACTAEECALLDGHGPAEDAQLLRQEEQEREAFFASLRSDIAAAAADPPRCAGGGGSSDADC